MREKIELMGVPDEAPHRLLAPKLEMTRPDGIAIQLAGGIGNQLFQYAAGRATSLRLGCELLLDTRFLEAEGNAHTPRFCALGAFCVDSQIETQASQEKEWLEYKQPAFHFDPHFSDVTRGTRLHGYFQSELFFKQYGDTIRRDLQLNIPTSSKFAELDEQIRAAAAPVSIHLRRGDYAENPSTRAYHGLCGDDFYLKAARIMEAMIGSRPDYFIFTDNPYDADRLFRKIGSYRIVETPKAHPWEDLILMARCRHHVLANSSFSWWGSWLNPAVEKIIIAPRLWFARETLRTLNTVDIHVDETILL